MRIPSKPLGDDDAAVDALRSRLSVNFCCAGLCGPIGRLVLDTPTPIGLLDIWPRCLE